MACYWALCALCAAVVAAVADKAEKLKALEAARPSPRPTRQPPTRAQDAYRCSQMPLPETINLTPKETTFFSRSGYWKDKNGAEMVRWVQRRFRFNYENVDYDVDIKPFFSARVLYNADKQLEHLRIWLPPPRKKFHGAIRTIVYEDCEHQPMYVSRELGRNHDFEIFNHLGEFVASGGVSDLVPDQLYFKDELDLAFAIAATPSISYAALNKDLERPAGDPWDFNMWQIWYFGGFNSESYLKEADNRWVVAAVVQEHAILNAMTSEWGPVDVVKVSIPYLCFVTLNVVIAIAFVVLLTCCCGKIFLMVYPPKKVVENKFLTMDIGGHPYGSFALTHQKPEA